MILHNTIIALNPVIVGKKEHMCFRGFYDVEDVKIPDENIQHVFNNILKIVVLYYLLIVPFHRPFQDMKDGLNIEKYLLQY